MITCVPSMHRNNVFTRINPVFLWLWKLQALPWIHNYKHISTYIDIHSLLHASLGEFNIHPLTKLLPLLQIKGYLSETARPPRKLSGKESMATKGKNTNLIAKGKPSPLVWTLTAIHEWAFWTPKSGLLFSQTRMKHSIQIPFHFAHPPSCGEANEIRFYPRIQKDSSYHSQRTAKSPSIQQIGTFRVQFVCSLPYYGDIHLPWSSVQFSRKSQRNWWQWRASLVDLKDVDLTSYPSYPLSIEGRCPLGLAIWIGGCTVHVDSSWRFRISCGGLNGRGHVFKHNIIPHLCSGCHWSELSCCTGSIFWTSLCKRLRAKWTDSHHNTIDDPTRLMLGSNYQWENINFPYGGPLLDLCNYVGPLIQ